MNIKKFRPLRTTDDFGMLEELTFLDVKADKHPQLTPQSPPLPLSLSPATPRPCSVSLDTGPSKTMSKEEIADTKTLDLASARKRMQETGEVPYAFQLPEAMSTPLPQPPASMSTPLPPSMKEEKVLKTPKETSPAAPPPSLPPEQEVPQLTSYQPAPCYDLETMVTRSGVHAMTLRTWERHYGIPSPERSMNSYPLYSRRDLAAIHWLRTRVEAGLSVCQAMAELARHEPEYVTSKGANDLLAANAVPQRRDLHELNESLLRAFVLLDETGAERILAQAFATRPASFVCQHLLQPVVAKITQMRKQNTLPLAVEVLVARMARSQVVYLIEAGLSPKEAVKRLSTLTLCTTHTQAVTQYEQEQRLKHAPDLYALEDLLIEAITHMDESRAQSILDEAFSYYPVEDVCLKLLQAVLYRVGMLWEEKKISIMIEHFASNIIRTRLAYLFQSTPDLRQGPTVLVGCAPRETHEIGILMLALFWRRAGLHVYYLGQMLETSSLLQEIRALQPGIVCLSATTRPRVKDLTEITRELNRMELPRPIICFGGGAFTRDPSLIRNIKGVFLGNDAAIATQRVRELVKLQATFDAQDVEKIFL